MSWNIRDLINSSLEKKGLGGDVKLILDDVCSIYENCLTIINNDNRPSLYLE